MTLKLALCGCGGMGRRHIRGMKKLQAVGRMPFDLVAVCDIFPKSAQEAADLAQELLGQRPAIYSDVAELRDIDVLNRMLGITVRGVASHGGMTGLNNLDFWRDRSPADLGLAYEAYDKTDAFGLFDSSFYISDSEWTRWKCYDRGNLCAGDRRSFEEHARTKHPGRDSEARQRRHHPEERKRTRPQRDECCRRRADHCGDPIDAHDEGTLVGRDLPDHPRDKLAPQRAHRVESPAHHKGDEAADPHLADAEDAEDR